MIRAGIDDLNIYGSALCLELAELARVRGLPAKDLQSVGFDRRTVTPPYEDPVTLAVNAAKPLVDAAGPNTFELLLVATESGVDYGKPLSSYVHRYLGLGPRCRNVEIKHACYGGTAALQLASSWVRSGAPAGKKALVVMTDVARRHFCDPAEVTAGSGAVALSVSAEPRMLALDVASGYACNEVYDVARPTATTEWGDAVLSLASYLDLLEGAWESYRAASGRPAPLDEQFAYMLYHTPLVSLAEQAHGVLLEADRDVTITEVRASFDRMVRPALGYARELANTYSGSVYCLLAGLLDAGLGIEPGTRVGLFSYGSGACAELYCGEVQPGARSGLAARRIAEHLAARAPVSVPEYEALVTEAEVAMTSKEYEPSLEFLPGHYDRSYRGQQRLVLRSVQNHHRKYGWS